MLYFATATDRAYLDTAFSHTITSVRRNMPEQAVQRVFCVDTGNDYDRGELDYMMDHLAQVRGGDKPLTEFYRCKRNLLHGINSNNCIQHGAFLGYGNYKDDDVIIFTDADVVMTRPMLDDELDLVTSLTNGEILVGYNNGPDHSIQNEYDFLMQWNTEKPTLPSLLEQILSAKHYKDVIQNKPCLNTGIVVTNAYTWDRLFNEYMLYWHMFDSNITHVAKQQLLMNIIIHGMLDWKELPQTFHSHGHWGEKPGLSYVRGLPHFNGTQVLFSHKLSEATVAITT